MSHLGLEVGRTSDSDNWKTHVAWMPTAQWLLEYAKHLWMVTCLGLIFYLRVLRIYSPVIFWVPEMAEQRPRIQRFYLNWPQPHAPYFRPETSLPRRVSLEVSLEERFRSKGAAYTLFRFWDKAGVRQVRCRMTRNPATSEQAWGRGEQSAESGDLDPCHPWSPLSGSLPAAGGPASCRWWPGTSSASLWGSCFCEEMSAPWQGHLKLNVIFCLIH